MTRKSLGRRDSHALSADSPTRQSSCHHPPTRSLHPHHSPDGAPACPPARARRPRLKLDELEPRIAPSALLYNLPFSGAMVDENDTADWTRMNLPGRTPLRADDADPLTDYEPRTADTSAIPSDMFSPVVPAELSPSRAYRLSGSCPDPSSLVVPAKPQSLSHEPHGTVFELLAESRNAEAEGEEFPSAALPLSAWDEAGRLGSVPTDPGDQSDSVAHDSGAPDTNASANLLITQRVHASSAASEPDDSANAIVYVDSPAEASGRTINRVSDLGPSVVVVRRRELTNLGISRQDDHPGGAHGQVVKSAHGKAARFAHGPSALDTTGPRVTHLTHAPGSTVLAAPSVVASFDEDLDPSTVSTSTFRVSSAIGADNIWGTSDDTTVAGTVTYDLAADTATFTPSTPFTLGTYGVWLDGTSSITDSAGNKLDGEWPGSETGFPSGDGTPGGDFVSTFAMPTAGGWVELGSDSAHGGGISDNSGDSTYPTAVRGGDGNPIAAWEDGSSGNTEIYVRRWSGSDWVEMGAGSATGGGVSNSLGESWQPHLALGADANPILAWADNSAGDFEIYVRRWDGTAWVEIGAGSASAGGISNNSGDSLWPAVAIGADGNPIIAWTDESTGDQEVYVRRWNGTAWVEMGAGSASGGGISNNSADSRWPAMVLGNDGYPVVAWRDWDWTGSDAEIFVRRWNGSAWAEMGTGSASGGGISKNTGTSAVPSLMLGTDGRPIVAWDDATSGDFEIYVLRWDGSSWVEMSEGSATGAGISDNTGASWAPFIAQGPGGNPMVSWDDNTSGDWETYVRRWDGTAWTEMGTASASSGGVSSNGGASEWTTIVLGTDGNPVIVWFDESAGDSEIYVRRWSPPDTTGPRVTGLTPSPGATVAAVASIVATFDEDLALPTVNTAAFKLSSASGVDGQWGTGDDTYVAGTVTYNAATDTATFTPSAPLSHGQYAVWLDGTSNTADLAGNRLDGEFSGAFPSGHGMPGGDFVATFIVGTSPTTLGISNVTVDEDAPDTLVDLWAAFDDAENADSELVYTVTRNSNPGIVSTGIQDGQHLTLDYATDVSGMANLTVRATDSEGLYVEASFGVLVNSVNDAPSFTKGTDEAVNEDAGPQTVNAWATGISAGPVNELSQQISFLVSNDNNALFASQPVIEPDGALTYTPAANAYGMATVTVRVQDDGGTANGGQDTSSAQTFTITVNAVNDAPTLDAIADPPSILEDASQQTVPLTGIAAGGGESQALRVTAASDNTSLIPNPSVTYTSADATGTLTYSPVADANGTAVITVTVTDTGLDGTFDTGDEGTIQRAFAVGVTSVNDAPLFTKGTDQTVNEDAGPQTATGWATGILAGPPNESSQTLEFLVSNDNNALFASQPVIEPDGTLRYTPAANANGTSTVTVRLQDDGGTTNGGQDTSSVQTFTIMVNPVNDAPSFTKGANQTVNEDSGPQAATGWATGLSAGPADESSQTLGFLTDNDNNSLFAVQPSIASDGTLSYTPAANANGSATVTVRLQDSGGTANGGQDTSIVQTFAIAVNPVNDAPSFTASDPSAVDEDAGAQGILGWASFTAGPANESGQSVLSYLVRNVSNAALFADGPSVGLDGTLSYTPTANAFGASTFDVAVRDSGATDNGGVDTSSWRTFTITVNPVNDAPTLTASEPPTINRGAGPQSLPGWASFSPGPANESGQALTAYRVSNISNRGLFAVTPAVAADGTLTYFPSPSAFGRSTFDIVVQDDGGTENGGADTSVVQTFTITANVELSPRNRRTQFRDTDGDTVTVSFGGPVGTAILTRTQGDFEAVRFYGTDRRTSLTVKVNEKTGAEQGDGTSVQTISGDGVGTLNMKNVDIVGNTINLNGALKTLVVDEIRDGSHITLGGSATDTLTLTAGQVGNVNLTFPGILKSATVTGWTGGTIQVASVGTLTVKNGNLGADVQADRIGAVKVTGGHLSGNLHAQNASADRPALGLALGSVTVTGGNITGSIRADNHGSAGPISAKVSKGIGGQIGDGDADPIQIGGRLASLTAGKGINAVVAADGAGTIEAKSGSIAQSITVNNQAGGTGNALNLVKVMDGSLLGAVRVHNGGHLGTLQARNIRADVTVGGKAALIRAELDNVVREAPPQVLATIQTGGKATVRGRNGVLKIEEGGGEVFIA